MTPHPAARHRPSAAEDPCPLDRVPQSTHAEVVKVDGEHGARRHLEQLGIRAGAILHVRRTAPLGGPILVEVRGSTVAIGRGLARRVLVRMV